MTRHIATFYMKSGNSFEVVCEDLTTRVNQTDGCFTHYQITYPKGYIGERPHQVVLDEIEAITLRPLRWWQ